jgi:hypothetical protein
MQVSAVSEREAARSFETLIQHGLSERAVVRYRASLSSFFTWCVREKIIVRNPVTGTKVPRSSDEPTEMRPWTDRAGLERLNDPYRGPTAAPVRQHNGRGYVGASPRAVLANITRCQSRDARGRDGKNPQVRATCGFFVVLVELRGFEPLTFSLRMAPVLSSTSAERLGCNASEDCKRTNCTSGVRRGYASSSSNAWFEPKWNGCFLAVSRSHDVIQTGPSLAPLV